MGLHLAKRWMPLAHMSVAWWSCSQGIGGRFISPDGANTVILMHHFPYTQLNQLKSFHEQRDQARRLSWKFLSLIPVLCVLH